MYFSVFCGRQESDGLFKQEFNDYWIYSDDFYGTMDDSFALWCMGGEL